MTPHEGARDILNKKRSRIAAHMSLPRNQLFGLCVSMWVCSWSSRRGAGHAPTWGLKSFCCGALNVIRQSWKNRHQSLKTICHPKAVQPTPPQWVRDPPHFLPSNSVNPEPKEQPSVRYRIYGKQSAYTTRNLNSDTFHTHNVSGEAASSSTDLPRRGIV